MGPQVLYFIVATKSRQGYCIKKSLGSEALFLTDDYRSNVLECFPKLNQFAQTLLWSSAEGDFRSLIILIIH